jgi:hypothetical protein
MSGGNSQPTLLSKLLRASIACICVVEEGLPESQKASSNTQMEHEGVLNMPVCMQQVLSMAPGCTLTRHWS